MRQVGDLYLAAVLRLKGHRPVRVLGDGHRAAWVFEATPELEADIGGFYAGTLMVPARDYAEAVRSAKGEALQVAGGAPVAAR